MLYGILNQDISILKDQLAMIFLENIRNEGGRETISGTAAVAEYGKKERVEELLDCLSIEALY